MQDRRVCPASGKFCYGGAGEARRAHTHAGFRIRIYRCDECGAFHVTNDEKRHAQERRRERERT